MNNQREIYEALLAGETLIHKGGMKAKLINGGFIPSDGYLSQPYFYTTDNWQIYKEPKWYENIPEGGVLCWCTDGVLNFPEIIVSYKDETERSFSFHSKDSHYQNAKPFTLQEIQVFIDNAPENKND